MGACQKKYGQAAVRLYADKALKGTDYNAWNRIFSFAELHALGVCLFPSSTCSNRVPVPIL